jgi:hypothetical protein
VAGSGGRAKNGSDKRDLDQSLRFEFPPKHCVTGDAMMPYEELVKLARFCAKEARTSTEKEVRSRAWRLAVQYREDAAKVGEPPDIGETPSDLEKI